MAVVVVASIMRNPILKQNQKKDIVNNIKKDNFPVFKTGSPSSNYEGLYNFPGSWPSGFTQTFHSLLCKSV